MIPPVRLPATIETPCVKICVLDPQSRLCRGCGRTIDEIGGWSRLTSAEREKIMTLLPGRLESLDDNSSHATA